MPSALALAGGRYSERVLRAIDWALTPDEADRPKSVSQLKAVLTGEVAAPPPPIAAAARLRAPEERRPSRLPLIVAAASLAVLAVAGLVFYPKAPPPAAASAEPAAKEMPPAAKPKAAVAAAKIPARETPAAKPVAAAAEKSKDREAAAAPTATVILAVTPQGEIILDGKKAGMSPPLTRLVVSAGVKHKIEIHGAGLPHYWTVDLQPGEKREIRANFASNVNF